tara:strand:+ start:6450 stop:7721 length:1272 start_codon:yes stop_codon:yes gene_type:complete
VRRQVLVNTNQQPVLRVLHPQQVQLEQLHLVVVIVPPVKSKPIVSKVHGIKLGRIGRALTVLLINIQHQVIPLVLIVPPIRHQQLVLLHVPLVMLVKPQHRDKPVAIVLLVKPQHQVVHVLIVPPTNTQQQAMHLVPTVLLVQLRQQVLPHVLIVMLVKPQHQEVHVETVPLIPIQQRVIVVVPIVLLVQPQQQVLHRVVIVLLVKLRQQVVHVETVVPVRTQQQVMHLVPVVPMVNTQQQVLRVVLPTQHVMPIGCQELVPQQQVHVRLVLVGGLLKIQMIAKPILPAVQVININQQMVQQPPILHVPLVRHVQPVRITKLQHVRSRLIEHVQQLLHVQMVPITKLQRQQPLRIEFVLPVHHVVMERKLQEDVVVPTIELVVFVQTQHVKKVAHSIRLVTVQQTLTQHVLLVQLNQHAGQPV